MLNERARRLRCSRAHRRQAMRLLCSLLLLLAMASPTSADDAKPLSTIVIVARADLPDPNFRDSLVLVMNNIGPAPIGVIINRPTRIGMAQAFPDNERLAAVQDKLYFGGPVEIAAVSFLFRADAPQEKAVQVLDDVYFSTNRALLDKLLTREKPMDGLRIFVGRSGWAPGQLEAEIARGDWTLTHASVETIFGNKVEHPWPERESPDAGRPI